LFAFLREFKLTPSDIVVQLTAFVFDAFVEEVFPLLVTGGKIAVPPSGKMTDMYETAAFIRDRGVTVIDCSPLLLNEFNKLDPSYLASVRYFISGGDVLKPGYIDDLLKTGVVYNTYGPTETTVCVTYYRCVGSVDGAEVIPIGKPISNYSVYVLDRGGQLLPPGVPGELCVSGAGVTRGYLNNPELTAERFSRGAAPSLPTPYYRTGDLVRWLPDGNVEFLGRIDQQVKVRGFRIELGEIESKLLAHEDIDNAVVVQKTDENGNSYLCGYIVSPKTLDAPALREYLAEKLPDYMIPWFFRQLKQFPLTPSGKIDRKALPEIETGAAVDYIPPSNPMEKGLVALWEEVLAVDAEKIGIDNGFFDLGGNSLKAIILVSLVKKQFNVEISLEDIFNRRTIRGIAKHISGSVETRYVAVEKAEKKEYYPATSAQRRLYVMQQVEPGSISYNLPAVIQLDGYVDGSRLEKTFAGLIKRHGSLRTSFEIAADEPVQRLHDEVEFDVRYIDGGNGYEEIVNRFVQPFDLAQAPLFRVALINAGEEKYILVVDMHHIISDGVSVGVLINEFAALFGGEELPELRLQYSDYAEWERRRKGGEAIGAQEAFWLGEYGLPGEIPVLDLPTDYPRPAVRTFAGRTLSFRLDGKDTRELRALASKQGMTLYMILLSIYYILLCKLSGREAIVVGTPTAGRRHADLEGIIGMFVNTLALKNEPAGEKTFNEFLIEVKEKTLKAFSNQDYQYETLVEKVLDNRDAGRNPLFDTMFILQNQDIPAIEVSGLKMKPYRYERDTSKFDLTLECIEWEGALSCNFEYGTSLFKEETIQRFINYFKKIISRVLVPGKRDVKISGIEIITEEEKRLVLVEFNDTGSPYPSGKTIHLLFEEQAARTPDAVALNVSYRTNMTYAQLNKSSDRLAGILREKGVSADTVVGIMTGRVVDMPVAILAVLKAGGAYLPIVPQLPAARREYMIRDAAVSLVLTHRRYADRLKIGKITVNLDDMDTYPGVDRCSNSPDGWSSKNAAYVIYTSGSTGRPKGSVIEHSQLINFIYHMHSRFGGDFGPVDNCLGLTEMSFDVSVCEFFLPLAFGATIVLLPETVKFDVDELSKTILEKGITFAYIPPGLLSVVASRLKADAAGLQLNKMLVGVEPIRDGVLEEYLELNPRMRILNGYGPTETTICATMSEYRSHPPENRIVPIGSPLSNMKAAIVDKGGNLVPLRVPGELCISGAGVGRGYLNNPELTAERFCRSYKSYKPTIFYKTGDLARWLENGDIEFIGRIDYQVKIRGYRVELGEIENRLLAFPGIKEAVVIARVDPGNQKYLCAYVAAGEELDMEALKESLSQKLPAYMVPPYITRIEKIPMTPHGKTDRDALPLPVIKTREEYIAPRDDVEKKLAEIWTEVLNMPQRSHASGIPIGIDDNFFELGGHSLNAAVLTARVHKVFNVRFPLKEFFRMSCIREMAEYIKGAVEDKFTAIEPVEKKEFYVLSSPQRRYYVLQQLDPENTSFNISAAVICEGKADMEKFGDTFRKLVKRHEIFRTSFHQIGGEVVQRIHSKVPFEIESLPVPGVGPGSADEMIETFIRPFDLSRAPLLRVGTARLKEEKHLLVIDVHHIVSDGLSQRLLILEFLEVYGGMEPVPLKIQYKDFAEWQNSERGRAELKSQEEYWLNILNEDFPLTDLPVDYPRGKVQSFEGDFVEFEIGPGDTLALKKMAADRGVTLYMIFLAVCNIWLSKICSRETVVIGSGVGGRKNPDLQDMVGSLQNMIVLINRPAGDRTFSQFLESVEKRALEAFENQDCPFDELVAKTSVPREQGRNPLFDFFYILNNTELPSGNDPRYQTPGLTFRSYPYSRGDKKGRIRFDLALYGNCNGETVTFSMEYGTNLFKSETIEQFVYSFKEVLAAVIENEDICLSDITLSSGLEVGKDRFGSADYMEFAF